MEELMLRFFYSIKGMQSNRGNSLEVGLKA